MRALLYACLLLLTTAANAQTGCPGCAVLLPNLPPDTLFLDPVPDGIKDSYYDEDLSFRMPTSTNGIPGVPPGIAIDQVEILNVIGLTNLGLDWTANQTVFIPAQQSDGCVKICGTPNQAGTFPVTIEVRATVLGGVQQTVPFTLDFVIIDTSAIISLPFGCAPLEVSFAGKPDATADAPVQYLWNFGNGQTSNVKDPAPIAFPAGTYPISLTSTVQRYVITSICATAVNNDWCGDAEELLCTTCGPPLNICPDLFFTLTNSNGVELFNSSDNVIGSTSGCQSGLSVALNGSPFVLNVIDEDPISPDDNLGTFAFTINGTGTFNFSGNGTSGNYTVALVTDTVITYVDTVTVLPNPVPVLTTTTGGPCLWPGQSVTLTSDLTTDIQWLIDGVPQLGGTSPSFTLSYGTFGDVSVQHTTADGCEAESALFEVYDCVSAPTTAGYDLNIALMPNPNNGTFTVSIEEKKARQLVVEVFNLTGRRVYSSQWQTTAGTFAQPLQLDNPAPGRYFIRFSEANGTVTRSFVVF